jgi:hypothetical protein
VRSENDGWDACDDEAPRRIIEMGANRTHDHVVRRRDDAAEHDDVRIESERQIGDTNGHPLRHVVDCDPGLLIPSRGAIDEPCTIGARFDSAGSSVEGSSTGVLLPTADSTAPAISEIGDPHVADLAEMAATALEATIDHETCSDARPDDHSEHHPMIGTGTGRRLRQRRRIRIVVHPDRGIESLFQSSRESDLTSICMRHPPDDSPIVVDEAGAPDADRIGIIDETRDDVGQTGEIRRGG